VGDEKSFILLGPSASGLLQFASRLDILSSAFVPTAYPQQTFGRTNHGTPRFLVFHLCSAKVLETWKCKSIVIAYGRQHAKGELSPPLSANWRPARLTIVVACGGLHFNVQRFDPVNMFYGRGRLVGGWMSLMQGG
jgi:hypothetical protein